MKRSHQVLERSIERDLDIRNGGPPGGIPLTPALTVKPSSTLKPGSIRKRKDSFQVEIITIDDGNMTSAGKGGNENKHDAMRSNGTTPSREVNNNRNTKQSQKQINHEKRDKSAEEENNGERICSEQTRETNGRGSRKKMGSKERSRERLEKRDAERKETKRILIGAVEEARDERKRRDSRRKQNRSDRADRPREDENS